MNFKGQLRFWLLFTIGSSTTIAFQPTIKSNNDGMPPKQSELDMTASIDASVFRNEIDINDVLAETEAALKAAGYAVPSSDSVNEELQKLAKIKGSSLNQMIKEDMISMASENDQLLTTAVVGSALGVVAGSPLVLGAALGVAGTHLLEGKKGEQAREVLKEASKVISNQIQSAAVYAHDQIEKEEDLSKVPEKVLLAVQEKINHELKEAREAPKNIMKNVKEALESEDVKAAPGKAFNALTAFINSNEVKLAQKKAMQAIKDGLESEEMQALKTRAATAFDETMKKSE